jgi:hypothetical protein
MTDTIEDTLKLIECTTKYLKAGMGKYGKVSFNTYKKRRSFGLQYINNKATLTSTYLLIASLEQRSTIIPTNWHERRYWVKVFELVLKLKVK